MEKINNTKIKGKKYDKQKINILYTNKKNTMNASWVMVLRKTVR